MCMWLWSCLISSEELTGKNSREEHGRAELHDKNIGVHIGPMRIDKAKGRPPNLRGRYQPTEKQMLKSNSLPSNISLIQMVNGSQIEYYTHVCLTQTNISDGDVDNDVLMHKVPNAKEIPGTTIWVNEWMAPGHFPYDIQMLQLLHMSINDGTNAEEQPQIDVDRIILQRAFCFRDDLCGNWDSFFRPLYTAMLQSITPRTRTVDVFTRRREQDLVWTTALSGPAPATAATPIKSIPVESTMCFERLLRRPFGSCLECPLGVCHLCFVDSITQGAVQAYQAAVTAAFESTSQPKTDEQPDGSSSKVITIAYRRNSESRMLANPLELARRIESHINTNKLLSKLPFKIKIELFDTFSATARALESINKTNASSDVLNTPTERSGANDHSSRGQAYFKQIRQSDIIICTHGAFVAHALALMRSGGAQSSMIELLGYYPNPSNNRVFTELARLFSIPRDTVVVRNLTDHAQYEPFTIVSAEIHTVIALVVRHFSRYFK